MSRRIGFVVPRYGAEIVGGAETLVRELAGHVAASGWDVEVLTTTAVDHRTWAPALPVGEERDGPVTVRRFDPEPRDVATFDRLTGPIHARWDVSVDDERRWLRAGVTSDALVEHLVAHEADYDAVVFAPYLFGLTYFGAMAVPERAVVIPCLHDEPYASMVTVRELLASVRGIVFNTHAERDLASGLMPLTPRTEVVGMGFDPPTAADPERFRAQHGLDGPFVLYAGRREVAKNTQVLIGFFSEYKRRNPGDLRLVLLGSGDVELPDDDTAQWIHDLGTFDATSKADAFAAATIFCQPSVNESLSIVLLESWLAGVPALVHGRCAVTVEHCRRSDGGLWFRNFPEWETEVDLLLGDPDLRSAMGARGRAYVEREFSWPAVVGRFRSAIEAWFP